jgi:hypothetical protein
MASDTYPENLIKYSVKNIFLKSNEEKSWSTTRQQQHLRLKVTVL